MITDLNCLPEDVYARDLAVRWDADLPKVLACRRLVASTSTSTLELAVIGSSHVATVEQDHGQFREEISCAALADAQSCWPLPRSVYKPNYWLETQTRQLAQPEFDSAAEKIRLAGPDWLIAVFPGAGPFHITALKGEWDSNKWLWWTHHIYPDEHTIVSTRSAYQL